MHTARALHGHCVHAVRALHAHAARALHRAARALHLQLYACCIHVVCPPAKVSLEPLWHHDVHEYSEALPTQGSLSFSVTWARVPAHLLETGTLRVHLRHATGLKSADRNGLSDPYAKLSLAGQQHRSKTLKKTLSPTWDESFEFKGVLRALLSEALQLHVFDHDLVSQDDVLGHASVDLRALRQHGARQHDLVAQLSGQGCVHLHVSWAARGQLHAAPSAPLARSNPRCPPRLQARVQTTLSQPVAWLAKKAVFRSSNVSRSCWPREGARRRRSHCRYHWGLVRLGRLRRPFRYRRAGQIARCRRAPELPARRRWLQLASL